MGAATPVQERCPNCGSTQVTSRVMKRMLPYGFPEPVTLVVDMPLTECGECELLYSGEAGETAVSHAVDRYQAVFGPRKG